MPDSHQPPPADRVQHDDQDAGRTSLTRMFPLHLGPGVPPADASTPRGEDAARTRSAQTTARTTAQTTAQTPGTPDS